MRFVAFALGVLLIACSGGDEHLIDAPTDTTVDTDWGPPDCCEIDDGPPACEGLDPGRCRLQTGCVADFCDSCSCTPTYQGCRAVDAPRTPCPVLDCPTPACCHADSDCTNVSCLAPGESRGCGICNPAPSECANDLECQAAGGIGPVQICQPIACSCAGNHACVPGCLADEECGDAETCDVPTGRCRPLGCSTADPVAPCPDDFDCVNQACARRACVIDATCDGFCVEGLCHGSLGECVPPVP